MSWGRTSNFTLRADKTVRSSAVGRQKRTLPLCIPPQGKKRVSGCPANSANPSSARSLGSRTDAPWPFSLCRSDATGWPPYMNRRQFLEAVAVGLVAAPALGSLPPGKLPTRAFGRTGLKVPILGFGSGSRFLMYKNEDEAIEALNRAIDLGITYIDTAHDYGKGKSEERIGWVMRSEEHTSE